MAFPTGYSSYQEVVIDHTQLSGDVYDFVLYLDLADFVKTGSDLFDTCRSDGGDIRATLENNTTQLPTELVDIDTTGKTGELWVNIGYVSSSTDTKIHIWYNGVDAALAVNDTYGRNAVWSSYASVYHLQEDPSGSAPQMIDSVGANDGTSSGSMTSDDSVAGQIGQALAFDWTDDYINSSAGAYTMSNAFSMSVWFYYEPRVYISSDLLYLLSDTDSGNYSGIDLYIYGSASHDTLYVKISRSGGGNDAVASLGSMETLYSEGWHLVTATSDGSTLNLYVDGTQVEYGFIGNLGVTASNSVVIGSRYHSVADFFSPYKEDEVRTSATTLSAEKLAAEYINQSNPTGFYSVGIEQTSGGGITISINPAIESNASLSFSSEKLKSVSIASETDTAVSLTSSIVLPIGLSSELNSALGLSSSKSYQLSTVSENDLAQPLTREKLKSIIQAVESDTPIELTKSKSAAISAAIENDIARLLGSVIVVQINVASETDAAQSFNIIKVKSVGTALETDISQLFASGQIKLLNPASENDQSQAISWTKSKEVNPATETDYAQSILAVKSMSISSASETDIANALAKLKEKSLNSAIEIDQAQAFLGPVQLAIGAALETDLAMNLIKEITFVDGNIHVLTAKGRKFVLDGSHSFH